jgi:glycosyltransferase involved in cell wall biosynthesis
VPDNAEVIQFSKQKLETGKIKSFFRIFKPMFLHELAFAICKLPMKYWISAFKIMYVDIHRATNLKNELLQFCNHKHLNLNDCVFYSYWHDYKALALAMLRGDNSNLKCIARVHRWDVFADKNLIPYLPFKKYIIENLFCTVSISQAGKDYFEQFLHKKLDEKVIVSRLGKFNTHTPVFKKNTTDFIICSCSNINPMKRLHLIVGILSKMQTRNVKWIHFGEGYEQSKEQILQTIKSQFPTLDYEFKGMVSNEKILDFYSQNYIDLFINVSDNEGIPVSIMEAMSAGIPVVATNVGGTSEIVNEKNGYLIDSDFDPEKVANVIDNQFGRPSEEQEKYRMEAYKTWQSKYDAQSNYTQFSETLLELK